MASALLPLLLLLCSCARPSLSKPQGDAVFFPGSNSNVGVDVNRQSGGVAQQPRFVEPASAPRSGLRRPAMADGFARDCAGWGALPYYDDDQGKWICHFVGEQGPCPDGYWFVLDQKSSEPKGICRKWDCGREDMYKLVETNECAEEATTDDCPLGMEVLINAYGRGECECVRGHVPYMGPGDKALRCYPQYLQGPCGDGEQLLQVDVFFQPGQGPCDNGEHLVDVSGDELFKQSPAATACLKHYCPPGQVRWDNGLCVDTVRCNPEERVTLSSEGLTCGIDVRQLISLGRTCPEGQGVGPNDKCIPLVDLGGSNRKVRGVRVASGRGGSLERFLQERFKN